MHQRLFARLEDSVRVLSEWRHEAAIRAAMRLLSAENK